MPSSGSFWIEPSAGHIVKTVLTTSDGLFSMESTVVFRFDDTLGLAVPAGMRESYSTAVERIFGKATCTSFRRFQVKTDGRSGSSSG